MKRHDVFTEERGKLKRRKHSILNDGCGDSKEESTRAFDKFAYFVLFCELWNYGG